MPATNIPPSDSTSYLKGLTPKMRMFVHHMTESDSFSPTEAARKAGYAHPDKQSARLIKDERIRKYLGNVLKKRMDRVDVTADRVLEEVAYAALRDPIMLCGEDGKIEVDDLSKIPEEMRRCIDGIKVKTRKYWDSDLEETVEEQTFELKLVPKLASLELLMKHLGMLAPSQSGIFVEGDLAVLNMYESAPTDALIRARGALMELKESAKKGEPEVIEGKAKKK